MLEKDLSIEKFKTKYVPENYIYIENINTIPFKTTNVLLGLLEYINPDWFNEPIKYTPLIVELSSSDLDHIDPNKSYLGSNEFVKWHYALDIAGSFISVSLQIEIIHIKFNVLYYRLSLIRIRFNPSCLSRLKSQYFCIKYLCILCLIQLLYYQMNFVSLIIRLYSKCHTT